jgi:hypothetical protein
MNKFNRDRLQLNAILVESSLIQDYTHLGYNKKLSYEKFQDTFDSSLSDQTNRTIWVESFKSVLSENSVKVIILPVDKKIDKDLEDFCRLNALVVLKVSLSEFSKTKIGFISNKKKSVVYVDDFKPNKHVLKLELSVLESKSLKNKYLHVNFVNCDNDEISVLIEAKLASTIEMYQEKLVHILKRIESVLKNKCYILGSGHIESYLYFKLTERELDINLSLSQDFEREESHVYLSLIKKIFSNTYKDMYFMGKNSASPKGNESENEVFYDDLGSKLEAWRLACFMNQHFLQSGFSLNF